MSQTKERAFAARCERLKLLLSDVDGVLTDGTFLMLPDGREAKSFHIRDGLGFVLAHRAGLRTGLLSGRSSQSVARRAEELGIPILRQGISDKLGALREILDVEGLQPDEAAYIGDDLPDLPVLGAVGLSAAPADAPFEVRAQVFLVTDTPGGRGCFRELVEAVLRARGQWEAVIEGVGGRLP